MNSTGTVVVRIEWFDNPARPQVVSLAEFLAENREDETAIGAVEMMREGHIVIAGGTDSLPLAAMWIEVAA